MMKNNKGITLITLVIMIIIILILASVGTTTGLDVIRQSKYNRAVAEMKAMQTKVNELYEEYRSGELSADNIGTDIPSSLQTKAETAYNSVKQTNSQIGELNDFRYYSSNYIEDTLDVDGIEDDYLVNIKTREVILIDGTKNDGEMYYSLSQIDDEQFNVEYINPGITYSPDGGLYILPKNITSENNLNMNIALSLQDIPNNMTANDLSIKYSWSTSKDTEPSEWIQLPAGTTTITEDENSDITEAGEYYLWTKIEDNSGKALNTIVSKKFTVKKEYGIKVKVSFDSDGGNVNPSSINVINKEQYGELPTPTREGYIFTGWYTDKTGGTKVESTDNLELDEENLPPTQPQSQTLYAGWEETSLMATSSATETSAFLGTSITRDKIKKVSFSKSIEGHEINNTDCWDVSEQQNGGVRLWISNTDGDGNVDVVIGQTAGVYANPSSGYLFSFIGNTINATIDLTNFNTSRATNMNHMFHNCKLVQALNVSGFDTSSATDMGGMFQGCSGLTSLDLSGFDTSNVKSMQNMFNGCSGLTSLDLSSFNTSQVDNMQSMFGECRGLTSLDLSNFNTSSVTTMSSMFCLCTGLKVLNVNSFNTSNVESMSDMFRACISLTTLNLSNFNTSRVTTMARMFYQSKSITYLNISSFNTSSVNYMNTMFCECNGLTSLDVSSFDTSSVTTMSSMFSGCNGLTSLDVSGFNTGSVTDMFGMFNKCRGLTSLDVSGFNTSQVTTMESMFDACSGLTSLDVSGFNTNQVTNMKAMFRGCTGLTSLNVSGFNTSQVTTMLSMFQECKELMNINISHFNTENVTNMNAMFHGCTGLSSIDLSNFNTRKVIDIKNMFYNCNSNLTTIYVGDNWDLTNATISGGMFYNCRYLVGDIPFNSSYTDKTYATKTGGYLTYKQSNAPTNNSTSTTSSVSGNQSTSLTGMQAIAKAKKGTTIIFGILIFILSGIIIWRIKKLIKK